MDPDYLGRTISLPMMHPGPLDPNATGLIGHWNVEGVQLASPLVAQVAIQWTESFEWLEGKCFMLHRVQGHVGAAELTCTEIIANEEIHSFYNYGRHQIWNHWFEEDRWMIQGIWRERGTYQVRCTSRFVGPDRRESIWERSTGTDAWEVSWRMAAMRVG